MCTLTERVDLGIHFCSRLKILGDFVEIGILHKASGKDSASQIEDGGYKRIRVSGGLRSALDTCRVRSSDVGDSRPNALVDVLRSSS